MKKWRVDYYKRTNWIHYKIVEAHTAEEAIKKANVRSIVEISEYQEAK
jgi:hypothetical protein